MSPHSILLLAIVILSLLAGVGVYELYASRHAGARIVAVLIVVGMLMLLLSAAHQSPVDCRPQPEQSSGRVVPPSRSHIFQQAIPHQHAHGWVAGIEHLPPVLGTQEPEQQVTSLLIELRQVAEPARHPQSAIGRSP